MVSKASKGWLSAKPNAAVTTCSNAEFAIMARRRLLLPIPALVELSSHNPLCDCGEPLDPDGFHASICKIGSQRYIKHNHVNAQIKALCDISGAFDSTLNMRNAHTHTGRKPDVIMFHRESLTRHDADTSITYPTTNTSLQVRCGFSSCSCKGWAAKLRTEQKVKKQQDIDQTAPGAQSQTDQFHPTIFETYGRWGVGSKKFFNLIFSEIQKTEPAERIPRMKSYWRNRISFSIARSDAKAILNKINSIKSANGSLTTQSQRERLNGECFNGG